MRSAGQQHLYRTAIVSTCDTCSAKCCMVCKHLSKIRRHCFDFPHLRAVTLGRAAVHIYTVIQRFPSNNLLTLNYCMEPFPLQNASSPSFFPCSFFSVKGKFLSTSFCRLSPKLPKVSSYFFNFSWRKVHYPFSAGVQACVLYYICQYYIIIMSISLRKRITYSINLFHSVSHKKRHYEIRLAVRL